MKITPFFLLPILALLFATCKGGLNCSDDKEEIRLLEDYYKKIFPYSGSDTLFFLVNKSDSSAFIGKGRTTFFETEYVIITPDCGAHKRTYEGYKENYGGLIIEQGQSPIPAYNNAWYRNYKINWLGNVISFYVSDIGSKDYDSLDTSYKYYDSIIVNGHVYLNVSEFTSYGERKLFANKQDGIILLYDKISNTTWEIIKK